MGTKNIQGELRINNEKVATMGDVNAIPQADWNQNDETAKDYIKNRPFCSDGITILWDGVIEGKELADVSMFFDEVSKLVKVSDLIWTGKENYTFTFDMDGESVVIDNDSDFITLIPPGVAICGNLFAVSVTEEGVATFASELEVTLPSAGTYFRVVESGNLVVHSLASKNIKTIDPKFLPSNLATEEYVNEQIAAEIPELPTNYMTTDGDQTGLHGSKEWTFDTENRYWERNVGTFKIDPQPSKILSTMLFKSERDIWNSYGTAELLNLSPDGLKILNDLRSIPLTDYIAYTTYGAHQINYEYIWIDPESLAGDGSVIKVKLTFPKESGTLATQEYVDSKSGGKPIYEHYITWGENEHEYHTVKLYSTYDQKFEEFNHVEDHPTLGVWYDDWQVVTYVRTEDEYDDRYGEYIKITFKSPTINGTGYEEVVYNELYGLLEDEVGAENYYPDSWQEYTIRKL